MNGEFFVWYRCSTEQTQAVLTAARTVLARVERETGVRGRLLQRTDSTLTWMEHYRVDALPSKTFERSLAHVVADVWSETLPARHGERFVLVPD